MFEPYALIPLAWSSLLIGRIAKGLLSLGQYERMEVWCRATVKNRICWMQKPFRFSIIHFVVQRLLNYILPRSFCFTCLFQFLCFLQQQKWVHSHCQWGNSSSRDSFFDAVRDNAVGGYKAVHVHSLQMFQNVLQKQMFTSGLMGNFKMSKGKRLPRRQLGICRTIR